VAIRSSSAGRVAVALRLFAPPVGLVGLGTFALNQVDSVDWYDGLLEAVGGGALLAAGALSGWVLARQVYLREMQRQLVAWRETVDTVFDWVEDLRLPVDAVRQLERAVEQLLIG
jgi:hypothetical protein